MNADRVGFMRRAGVALTWSMGFALGGSQLAQAVGSYKVDAETGVEYNSNIFDIPQSQPLPLGVQHRGDVIEHYTLGGDVNFGDPVLSADLSGKATHFTYDRIGELTHNEESAAAKIHWHPGEIFDLQASYVFERAMAPFAQTLTTQLSLDTNKTATVILGVYLSPVWRVDLSPFDHEALTPLNGLQIGPDASQTVNFSNFRLHEEGASATLNYLGIAHLTAGLEGIYTHGDFSQISAATKYDQYTGQFVAKYNIDTLSTLSATLGYTLRNTINNMAGDASPTGAGATITPDQLKVIEEAFTGDLGRTDGVTGTLTYSHTLTPKTGFDVNIFRLISSYAGAANTLTATGIGAGFHWKPDFRFDIDITGSFEQDEFGGDVIAGLIVNGSQVTPATDRTDHLFSTLLKAKYMAFSWLSATGHFDYSIRTSNLSLAGYSGFDVGLDLTATWK